MTSEAQNKVQQVVAHVTNDPSPPRSSNDDEAMKKYQKELETYVNNWCKRYENSNIKYAEMIWSDFIEDFSVTAIREMSRDSLIQVRRVMMSHGVLIKYGRGNPMIRSMLSVLMAQECPIDNCESKSQLKENVANIDQKELYNNLNATSSAENTQSNTKPVDQKSTCLLYTSDAADD